MNTEAKAKTPVSTTVRVLVDGSVELYVENHGTVRCLPGGKVQVRACNAKTWGPAVPLQQLPQLFQIVALASHQSEHQPGSN